MGTADGGSDELDSRIVSLNTPEGVLGAEVRVKLIDADSPAPTDPAALTVLTITTNPSFRPPATTRVQGGRGRLQLLVCGGVAVSIARWVNTRSEMGLWSEITTATVAG